jgi:phosphatidate cytidylyltransferase
MEDPTNRNEPVEGAGKTFDDDAGPQGAESPSLPPARRFPSSNIGRPRIEGVEAGVAAGLVPPPGESEATATQQVPRHAPRHLASTERLPEEPVPPEIVEGVELPDWTDPPTREVPRVLLRPGEPAGPVLRGPVWRESDQDFDDDQEAFAEIVSGSTPVVEHDMAEDDDFAVEDFGELDRPDSTGRWSVTEGDPSIAVNRTPETGAPIPTVSSNPATTRLRPPAREGVSFAGRVSREGARRGRPRGAADKPAAASDSGAAPAPTAREEPSGRGGRNPVVATVTGAAIGAVALLCFWIGPEASLAIASLVLLLAQAELFQSLRRAHYQPATLLGLVAAPGFAVAAYVKGPVAIPIVGAVAVVATLCWYLAGITRRHVVANISATMFGIGWVAFLGSFAGLLLDPTVFALHHGVAYLLGAVEVTVAYDVGGYAFGSWLGKHPLAPSVSPNKTWEGLLAGSLCALVVAIAITSQMHPWTLSRAVALGLIAAVVAPIGDLAESMVKRDLNLKDMGTLLPAHGGILDRVDALLFMLPATYLLVRLFHG